MGLPYTDRRELLERLELKGSNWQVPDYVTGDGRDLQAATRAQGLEGIVAKRLDSPYEPGRRSIAWRKIKNVQRTDVVVCGWMPGEGRRSKSIGALLVAVEEEGHLRYAGRVGTGFTDRELDRLLELLEPLVRDEVPWTAGPKPPARRRARRAAPRRRGRVHRVDVGWCASCTLLQGPARGCPRATRSLPRRRAARPRRHGGHRRGPRPARHQPRQGPLSRGRLHEARRHRVPRAHRARAAAAPPRPPAHAEALPQRRRRRALLREELAQAPARTGSGPRRCR